MQARTGTPTGFATALRNQAITPRSPGMAIKQSHSPQPQRGAQPHPRSSGQRSTQEHPRPGRGSPRKQRPMAEEEE